MSRWREFPIRARAAGIVASPYYEWARATRFAHYGTAEWLPVLIKLRKTTAQKFARRVFKMQQGNKRERGWASGLRVPRFYASPPERLRKPTTFVSALATRAYLEQVYRGGEASAQVERFEIGASLAIANGQQAVPAQPRWEGQPPRVVTGVIDDGIAFGHERFLGADGTTRIEYFWDQQVPGDWYEWPYGREFSKRDPADGIDRRMRDSKRGAHLDEDELYRTAGFIDQTKSGHKPLAHRGAHGTHVMDLAVSAGTRPQAGTRPIIAVQLPTATTADSSGATLAPQIYNALAYLIRRAEDIQSAAKTAQLPVVANVSYGLIAGPHDGSSMLEQAIDELVDSCNKKGPPLRVVLPAGNSHLSRCHAWFDLELGQARELHWRVLPDDWSESHVEVWLPETDDGGGKPALSITLAAPDGSTTTSFVEGVVQAYDTGADVIAWATYYPAGEAGRRPLLWLSIAPTGSPDGGIPLAPAGVWRIAIRNAGKQRVSDVHAWIQRDDTPVGYPRRSRQSYFDDPGYAQYDDGGRPIESDVHARTRGSYVKRRGTINAIATGKQPIVIGGLRRSDWNPAPYSSSGPVVNYPPGRGLQTPDGPEALSVSEDTPYHRGVLAAGSRSGSCIAMHGTSVAAPQVARWVAEELAHGRAADRKAVAKYAKKVVAPPTYTDGNRPPGAAQKPSRERGGNGRIEFASLRKPRSERL